MRLDRVARLREPVALAVAEDDTTLYAGERVGRVRVIRDGRLDPTPLLDQTGEVSVEGRAACSGWRWHPTAGICT